MEIGILAGHDPEYYEFRVYRNGASGYDMYRVDRELFTGAIAGLGLDKLDRGEGRAH